MAGEVNAFSNLLDAVSALASELKLTMGHDFPLQLLTESRSLFGVIWKGSHTSEKRLMLQIAAARERFKNGTILNIGFVRSSQIVADGLKKAVQ